MVEYDPKDWPGVLVKYQGSVLPRLMPRILIVLLIGLGASYLHQQTGFKLAPVTHTILGLALGLLLVFRTNASYDRYWEGRKLLGGIVNRMRNVMRQVTAYADDDALRAQTQRRLHVTFALVRQYLRLETDLQELGAPITEDESARLADVKCRPVVYLTWLSRMLGESAKERRLPPEAFRNIDESLTTIVDSIGGAERIVKTPVPFAYAQHIKGFLFVFCFTVPFVLVDQMGWYACLGSAVVAYALFGIEEIGVEIEDPFGDDPNDLPVDIMERGVANVTQEIAAA